jgi:hypothetical protein
LTIKSTSNTKRQNVTLALASVFPAWRALLVEDSPSGGSCITCDK